VDWKLHIPSPTKRKEWDAFWTQYLFEKRETARFHADPRVEQVELPLLNRRLLRAKPGKEPVRGLKRTGTPGRSGRVR
jgi:squalene cyclase